MNAEDSVARARARLSALKAAVGPLYSVESRLVDEFHDILVGVERLGIDADDFRLRDEDVRPRMESSVPLAGEYNYSSKRYVSKALFTAKLDAALAYLDWRDQNQRPDLAPGPL